MVAVRSLALVFLFSLCASVAHAEIYQDGPHEVCGYGATEAEAISDAQDALDDFIADFEANLPANEFVMFVAQQGTWDGTKYTITFTLHVFRP